MKTKKILAVASCAALVAAAALPLAACGGRSNGKALGKGEVDLANYAIAVEDSSIASRASSYSKDAVSLTELGTGFDHITPLGSMFYLGTKVGATETKGTVFNIKTGKAIIKDITAQPGVVSTSFIRVADAKAAGATGPNTYTYYGEDGTKLLSGSEETYFYPQEIDAYINGELAHLLAVVEDEDNIKYFKVETDDDGNKTYSSVSASSIKYVSPDYSAGAEIFGVQRPVYEKSETRPVEGEITNYTYAVNGEEMVFYKNGEESGRLNIENSNIANSAFVGNYYYYATSVVLPEDGDANVIEVEDGTYVKYDYMLHRYDIISNKDEKLDYNVTINAIQPVYNYTAKAYDAAVITVSKKVNNVVQFSGNTYVTDAKLGVAYDISNIGLRSFELIKADEGKYIVPGYSGSYTVVNDKFEKISAVNNATYYANEKVFGFSVNNRYGFAGLDGKVVIEPAFVQANGSGVPVFYGGKALVGNYNTMKTEFLSANGTTTVAPTDSHTETQMVDVDFYDGWYAVETTVFATDPSEDDVVTTELFDFSGKSLKKFGAKDTANNFNDSSVITVRTVDTEGNATYSLYLVK